MNDYESGRTLFMPDTRFITEFDQYLFGQGTHYDLYNKLGAHPMTCLLYTSVNTGDAG